MFVAIGRLGRSLGMHLLLASQRLDEGRLRGLEAHLSYRVCLKTLSASESRTVLGTLDAYELPNTPGAGFLRSGDRRADSFPDRIRFRTGADRATIRRQATAIGAAFTTRAVGAGRTRRAGGERDARAYRFADGPGPAVGTRTARAPSLAAAAGGGTGAGRPVTRRRIRAGRSGRSHRHRRSPVRAAPDAADGRLIRSRGQCRGRRRTPIGQVDGTAHADHGVGRHARSGSGAVLLPGLRRWSAGFGARHCRTWVRWPAGPSRGSSPHDRRAGIDRAGSREARSIAASNARIERPEATRSATCFWSSMAGQACAMSSRGWRSRSLRLRPRGFRSVCTWCCRRRAGRRSDRR